MLLADTGLRKTRTIAGRILATFAVSALSVIGAGALVGVEIWQAALMAGIGGIATVVEALSRAYLKDGNLTYAEIDEVFAAAEKRSTRRK